jgi:hypothetical protein
MTYIGDIAHVAHLIAEVQQIAVKKVKGYSGAGVAQMGIAIDSGAADIHAYVSFVDGLKQFLVARQGVVDK